MQKSMYCSSYIILQDYNNECFLQSMQLFPPTGYTSRTAAAKMKSLLVFTAIIAVTFSWRNYAYEGRSWPMPLPSEPRHLLQNFHLNKAAMVQSKSLSNDIFKAGDTYFLFTNESILCVRECKKISDKMCIKRSAAPPAKSCCFIASTFGNGIVALKSCSERKYITMNESNVTLTSNVIDEAAKFTVEVSSPGRWNGTQYVYLKTSDKKYWSMTEYNSISVSNDTEPVDLIVMEAY